MFSLSLAFSARAAWADWIARDVPGKLLVGLTLGDWGFNGKGGGARSGSELSHLFHHVSRWNRGLNNEGQADWARRRHSRRS